MSCVGHAGWHALVGISRHQLLWRLKGAGLANVKKTKTGALALAVCGFALAVVVGFWMTAIMLAQHDLERTLAEIDDSTRNLTLSLSEHAARTLD